MSFSQGFKLKLVECLAWVLSPPLSSLQRPRGGRVFRLARPSLVPATGVGSAPLESPRDQGEGCVGRGVSHWMPQTTEVKAIQFSSLS